MEETIYKHLVEKKSKILSNLTIYLEYDTLLDPIRLTNLYESKLPDLIKTLYIAHNREYPGGRTYVFIAFKGVCRRVVAHFTYTTIKNELRIPYIFSIKKGAENFCLVHMNKYNNNIPLPETEKGTNFVRELWKCRNTRDGLLKHGNEHNANVIIALMNHKPGKNKRMNLILKYWQLQFISMIFHYLPHDARTYVSVVDPGGCMGKSRVTTFIQNMLLNLMIVIANMPVKDAENILIDYCDDVWWGKGVVMDIERSETITKSVVTIMDKVASGTITNRKYKCKTGTLGNPSAPPVPCAFSNYFLPYKFATPGKWKIYTIIGDTPDNGKLCDITNYAYKNKEWLEYNQKAEDWITSELNVDTDIKRMCDIHKYLELKARWYKTNICNTIRTPKLKSEDCIECPIPLDLDVMIQRQKEDEDKRDAEEENAEEDFADDNISDRECQQSQTDPQNIGGDGEDKDIGDGNVDFHDIGGDDEEFHDIGGDDEEFHDIGDGDED